MADSAPTKLGDIFNSRREKGRPGLPMMSVTINNGLVERESLDRKTDTKLTPKDHLLIKKGDIAYNMMRMWQGASGLADKDGIVSPAYVVVAPKDGIDPLFASYWLKSPRMIYLLGAYSYGLTKDRLRLYYKDFARIPVRVPPMDRQLAVAKALRAWDRAVGCTENLIQAKRERKRGLLKELLTKERRFRGFRKPWRRTVLRELGKCIRGVTYKSGEDLHDSNNDNTVRLLRAGNILNGRVLKRDLQYVSRAKCQPIQVMRDGDLAVCMSSGSKLLVGKAARYFADDAFQYVVGAFCSICRPRSDIARDVLPHLFESEQYKKWIYVLTAGSSINNLTPKDIEGFSLDLPSCERELGMISTVLNRADAEIEGLNRLCAEFRHQKRGLMQTLFDQTGEAVRP